MVGWDYIEYWSIFHRVKFNCRGDEVIDTHVLGDTDVNSKDFARMIGRSRWQDFNTFEKMPTLDTKRWYDETQERWTNVDSYMTKVEIQREYMMVKVGGKMGAATSSGGVNVKLGFSSVNLPGGISVGFELDPGNRYKAEPSDKASWGRTYKICCQKGKPSVEVLHQGPSAEGGVAFGRILSTKINRYELKE